MALAVVSLRTIVGSFLFILGAGSTSWPGWNTEELEHSIFLTFMNSQSEERLIREEII